MEAWGDGIKHSVRAFCSFVLFVRSCVFVVVVVPSKVMVCAVCSTST